MFFGIKINDSFGIPTGNFNTESGTVFFINKFVAIETRLYYKFGNYIIHHIYTDAGFNLRLDRSSKK